MQRLISLQRWIIIAVVVVVVCAYMTTYQVRFSENAVVTTFGRADQSSVIKDAGLRFKIPYVQRETKYDRRERFLEARPETVPTSDKKQVVVTAFLTWQVADPLSFYQKYSGRGDRAEDHYRAAEADLQARLRSAMNAEFSKYALSELVTTGAEGSKLDQLEQGMLKAMQGGGDGAGSSFEAFGIKPVAVGISAMKFPSDTTKKVFDAMSANRAKIANAAISEGATRADTIKKTAESDAQEIRSFASAMASQIRNQGLIEAQQYLAQMSEAPDLAVFLKNMDFVREFAGRQTTIVLGTNVPGFDVFGLNALKQIRSGAVPDLSAGKLRSGAAASVEPAAPQQAAQATPAPGGQP